MFLPNLERRKCWENRDWVTDYRGPLYIHASGKPPGKSPDMMLPEGVSPAFPDWQCGKIIGKVDLVAIVEKLSKSGRFRSLEDVEDECRELMLSFGITPNEQHLSDIDYQGSKRFWLFANAETLSEPIETKGRLGLWNYML